MTQVLADKAVKSLLGSVILGTDESYLNPNGIELRLGNSVKFHSTQEVQSINPGDYLKVGPGQAVTICSLEKIDFSPGVVAKVLPGKQLMGLITPTTTMMREGISQITTKVDSGYCGYLNWSLRNNSFRDIFIEQGEPIYKLTLLALEEEEELPASVYGERDRDQYQGGEGIQNSTRRISAVMQRVVQATNTDPRITLEEAGFPFNQIAKEFDSYNNKLDRTETEFKSTMYKVAVGLFGALSGLAGLLSGLYAFFESNVAGSSSMLAVTGATFAVAVATVIGMLVVWSKKAA